LIKNCCFSFGIDTIFVIKDFATKICFATSKRGKNVKKHYINEPATKCCTSRMEGSRKEEETVREQMIKRKYMYLRTLGNRSKKGNA
jgi:hypothetical protein